MRVLFVHNYYQQAGGEDLVVKMEMDLLKNNGHDVSLYSINNESIKTSGGRFLASLSIFFNIMIFFKLYKKLRMEKPDVVHCHNMFPLLGPAVIYACWGANVKCVLTLHNYRIICPSATLFLNGNVYLKSISHGGWSSVKDKVYRNSFLGSAVISMSNALHKWLGTWDKAYRLVVLSDFQRHLLEPRIAGSFFIKPNFLLDNESNFENKKRETESEVLNFLFVGRLSVEKGVLRLIDDWPENRNFSLTVVGYGDQYDDALKLAKNRPNINIVGGKCSDEVLDLMISSDALVVPSLWYEGCPMVILEALRVGVPILANDIGSLSEMVSDKWNGLKYDAMNKASIGNVLEEFRSMDHASLRENCLIDFNEKYSEKIGYQNLVELYT